MIALLDAALAYAAAGVPVFPCNKNKQPLTPHGFKDATRDDKKIRRWWTKWNTALIGMPTGKASGVAVLDLDTKGGKNGLKAIKDWKRRSKVIARTVSGGVHLYYKAGDIPSTTNKIGEGVDTRGTGGYVIVPPSPGYVWVNGYDFAALEEWPVDLRPPVTVARDKVKRRFNNMEPADPDRVARALRVIPADDYDTWYKTAGALRNAFGDTGFELFEIWSKTSDKYSARKCQEKWDQAEKITEWSVASIYRWATECDKNWDELPMIPDGAVREDFVAYMPHHNYMYLPTRTAWPAASVNAKLPKQQVGDRRILASVWLDNFRSVEIMTWAPGEDLLIRDRLVVEGGWVEKKGSQVLNQYMPPTIKLGDARKAKPWVDLVRKVYPDDAEHIFNYFAQRVQQPGVKINHCLLLGGLTGIGKDTIVEALVMAVGEWNCAEVSPQALTSSFNPYLKSVVLRVSETRDMGELNRYQFHDHTKTLMAAPPNTLTVNEKHTKPYMVFNVTGVIMTSNHKTNGIYLPEDDRRHYVAWSPAEKTDFPDKFWSNFYKWYRDGGFSHIAAYLHQRDISNFDPKAAPNKTEAFLDIVDANRAPEDMELNNALSGIKREVYVTKSIESEVLDHPPATTWYEVFHSANSNFGTWLDDRKNRRAFNHRMEACGYAPCRNPDRKGTDGLWGEKQNRFVIYTRKVLSHRDQLAAAVEYDRNFKEIARLKRGLG